MRIIFIQVGVLLLLYGTCYSQRMGYISKEDTLYEGGKVKFDTRNPFQVIFYPPGEDAVVYNAKELSAFGFVDSSRFVSKEVFYLAERQRIFVEVLQRGPLNLYLLEAPVKKFFLEGDSLIELDRDNYREKLMGVAEICDNWHDEYKLIRYNSRSLGHLIYLYNNKECPTIPFASFGLLGGISYSRLVLPEKSYFQNIIGSHSISSQSVSLGFYFERPFWNSPKFSLHNSLSFERQSYLKEILSPQANKDILIDATFISLGVAPKFTVTEQKSRPYLYAGVSTVYSPSSESRLFLATFEEEFIILENIINFVDIPQIYYGYKYGAGIKLFYRYDHYVEIDASSSMLFSDSDIRIASVVFTLRANL